MCSDSDRAAKKREYNQRYYAQHRQTLVNAERARYQLTREEANARRREKYANDPEYRAKRLAAVRKYQSTALFRKGVERRRPQQRESSQRSQWRAKLASHGVTPEWFEATLERQGGTCAICHGPETTRMRADNKERRLTVDHDHTTGKARGLLCANCNRALGLLRDDVERIAAAITYLTASRQ